jgi:hypothetical protein
LCRRSRSSPGFATSSNGSRRTCSMLDVHPQSTERRLGDKGQARKLYPFSSGPSNPVARNTPLKRIIVMK